MTKYFGYFKSRDEVAVEFKEIIGPRYGKNENLTPNADFPTDRQILFASYGGRSYEGDAWVIFTKDRKLYEVNGSHCSCFGLEGQWKPEETSWEAIAMRNLKSFECLADHDDEAIDFIAGILRSKKLVPILKGRYE